MFVVVVMFDVIITASMKLHMLWIALLELIFLFVFARMCGVDYIYTETQRAIDSMARWQGAKSKQSHDNEKEVT